MQNPNRTVDFDRKSYVLPQLPYDYAALEPVIDAATMKWHHDAHHQAYVDGINAALAKHPEWRGREIDYLLKHLSDIPADIRDAVRDQGGGFANHNLFWQVLRPRATANEPGDFLASITRTFGSFETFKKRFEEAGIHQFGSGWVFLAANPAARFDLEIVALPNQDSVVTRGLVPLLACDVWEHAYYLKYQSRRAEWLHAWWDIVNWNYVNERASQLSRGATTH